MTEPNFLSSYRLIGQRPEAPNAIGRAALGGVPFEQSATQIVISRLSTTGIEWTIDTGIVVDYAPVNFAKAEIKVWQAAILDSKMGVTMPHVAICFNSVIND